MSATEKTPILVVDIRKGDLIRVEYLDFRERPVAKEFWAEHLDLPHFSDGAEYFLLNRPVPPVVLPDAMGYYLDKDFGLWSFEHYGYKALNVVGSAGFFGADQARKFAPFTRLRPVAEVAAEVLADVAYENKHSFKSLEDDRATVAAKWATK